MEDTQQPHAITIPNPVLDQTKEQLKQLHDLNHLKRTAAHLKKQINAVLTDIQKFQREHSLPISSRPTLSLSDEETVQEKSLNDQIRTQQFKNDALTSMLSQYQEKRTEIVLEQIKNEPYNP